MNKIRIAFVETNCKKNGPIKQTWNIIKHMDRDIFEPALITIWPEEEGNSMIDDYRNLNIPVYCCNISKKKSIVFGQRAVGKFLEQFKADIVQGVGIPPYRMTLGYKKAVHFVTLRNYCYEDYPDQYAKGIGTVMAFMDMQLIRRRMKMGEPFVTCSESLTNMYREKENLEIPFIRNGVDVSQYTKRDLTEVSELRERLELPKEKIIFVYSGGLIDRKNQREAIEGFLKMQHNDNATLLLLGDGKERGELEEKYSKYSNITFRGKVSNVNEYLHACDVYLATSKSEGLPNGVLEAMACGLPILLSNIPQHLEVLEADESCGYSYRLGDIEELASTLDRMMNDNLVAMGERSYHTVMDNFTAEGMSLKYQRLYMQIFKNKRE